MRLAKPLRHCLSWDCRVATVRWFLSDWTSLAQAKSRTSQRKSARAASAAQACSLRRPRIPRAVRLSFLSRGVAPTAVENISYWGYALSGRLMCVIGVGVSWMRRGIRSDSSLDPSAWK